ncbi:hypothetical protein B7463_g5455, partial [Scytalidium lignicola]
MSIKLSHTLNPITALEIYHSRNGRLVTLAGEGVYLKVFDFESSELIGQYRIFESQTIHGIVVSGTSSDQNDLQVVIWGRSCLTIIRNKLWELLLSKGLGDITSLETTAPDWILDVALSPTHHDRCVLVTAHNTLIQASIESESESDSILIKTLESPSRSMLYSANVTWDSDTVVTIAAGTVFGEIIVWECTIPESGSHSAAQVFYTLTGHEGSIFGVNLSSTLRDKTGNNVRLLTSCSDDRTIRIWDVSRPINTSTPLTSRDHARSAFARETGFGTIDQRVNGGQESGRCLGMIMGHASRIWNVKFLQLDSTSVQVLSFGEDTTVQQWKMDIEFDRVLKQLIHIDTFAFHSGKHLWSSAFHQVSESRVLIATGGADGKISSYTVSLNNPEVSDPNDSGLEEQQNSDKWHGFSHHLELDFEEVLSYLSVNGSCQTTLLELPAVESAKELSPTDKVPKEYGLVAENLILATTSFGRVLTCKLGTHLQWEELKIPESHELDLRSYSIVKGLPEAGVAFTTGMNGKIFMYQQGSTIQVVGDVGYKVTDMFPFVRPDDMSVCLLINTLGGEVATLYQFDQAHEKLFLKQSLTISLPAKFVATSAGYCNGFLILGSRNGSIAVYEPNVQENAIALWKVDIENGDAITAVATIETPSTGVENHEGYFLTTGRNGIYSIFHICTNSDPGSQLSSPVISPVHHGTPPFGPVIEAGWFEGSDLFLCGFRSKHFVVWNETKRCEIASVECGGAHRSFAYSHLKGTNGGGYFVYTKASKLHIYYQPNSSHRILKQGGHGREIKACALSPNGRLMATGGEDTAIWIWKYCGDIELERRFECLTVRQKHSAGIQHVQWYGENYLLSSGGVEEFYIWSITPIPGFGIGIVCEAGCPDLSEDKDLRIMSFDVSEPPGSMRSKDEQAMLISLAYSDSTIRTYIYSKSSGFTLLATGRYTNACLMQIQSIQQSSEEMNLITAATDGKLAIWKVPVPKSDITAEWQMISAREVHQNSIKSMDVITLEHGKRIAVATGGDDNALGITIYNSSALCSTNTVPPRTLLRSAHAAAITGLCCLPTFEFIGNGEDTEFRIVTSSNDQRVKEWSIRLNSSSDKQSGDKEQAVLIHNVGDAFTTIADVGDMALINKKKRRNEQRKRLGSASSGECRNGATLRISPALEILAISEALFYTFIYIPYSFYLQREAIHPSVPTREERRELFIRCTENIEDTEAYLRKWFLGAPLEDIRRDNVKEFFLWAFLNRCGEVGDDDEELEEYVCLTERRMGRRIEEGRGSVVALRLTLDPVDMLHRSLTWYLCVGFVDFITHVALVYHGFHFHRIPMISFFNTFPFRPQTLLTTHHSPAKHTNYWYRKHTSKDKLPILFIHGIGIGLFPYVKFLAELNSLSGVETTDPDDQVGIIAIEILPVSFRITHHALNRQEMCQEIDQILQKHFSPTQKFVLVSHSYGSVISTHLLKFCPSIAPRIGAIMLIDPVTILLHLPDVAYNFTRRKPNEANEHQLYYFASMDMGVSHTLSRHFFWNENILWKEDLKDRKVTVCLAGRDLIVDTAAVGRYLSSCDTIGGDDSSLLLRRNREAKKPNGNAEVDESWKSRPWKGSGIDILWFKELDHAQIFDYPEGRAKLIEAIRIYCKDC